MAESTATLTLTDFLLARIAEDEEYARLWCHEREAHQGACPKCQDRALAECEAKRRIVEEVLSNPLGKWRFDEPSPWALHMLGILALPLYADHPDYREEWKP